MRIFFQGRCVLGCPCTMASLSSFSRLCMSTIQRVNTSHEDTFELSEATCHVKCVFYPVRWSRLKLIPVERCILAFFFIPFALCKCLTVRYGGSLLEVTHCCVWRPGLWMQTGGHPAPVTRDSAHHSEWDNPKKRSRRRKKRRNYSCCSFDFYYLLISASTSGQQQSPISQKNQTLFNPL